MGSCRVENPQVVSGNIAIEPVITKATETDFEEGDKIGVNIIHGGEVYASNECMVYDGEAFVSSLQWYTSGDQNSDFVAYYPYTEIFPTHFSVASDQGGDGYGNSDLMAAVKENVIPQATVSMVFKHLLTRIVINIDNQGGAKVNGVVLKNSILDANVDPGEGVCTIPQVAAPQDISAHEVAADTKYIAIVIPQTVKFKVEVELQGGKTLSKSLSEVTLEAGGQYSINMVVLPNDVNVALSGEIEAWNDKGLIPEKQVEFHEYDGYFEYDGVRYNTVVLSNGQKWMAENLRYIPENCKLGKPGEEGVNVFYPYSTDGSVTTALTDDESVAKYGLLYSGDVLFNTPITTDNVHDFAGAQGICPPGWHIPSRAEYLALCGNSNKDDSGTEKGNVTDANALFYDSAYSAGKVKKFNDAGWNFIFSGAVVNNAYNKIMIDSSKCIYEEWLGSCAMSYYWSSTGYVGTGTNPKPQFFGLMTTFTSANNEGKVSLSYCTATYGAALRCLKDKDQQSK
ncbi:MAG: fimbrillin family protein [Bacteroidales bacterium]|nr:fimbrillin family protein [Bacteroidales bacterium]